MRQNYLRNQILNTLKGNSDEITEGIFRRKKAVTLAEAQFGIKERTADLYLSKLVAFKWIEKTRNGIYQEMKS